MLYQFQQALKAVIPHAHPKTGGVPVIESVLVRPGECVATDRYTAAWSNFEYTGDSFEPFVLPIEMAKEIAKIKDPIDFEVEDTDTSFRTLTVRDALGNVRTFVLPDLGTFPAVDRLLPSEDEEPFLEPKVLFTFEHLAKFQSKFLARNQYEKTQPIHFTFHRKHMVARFSNHFKAIIGKVHERPEEGE